MAKIASKWKLQRVFPNGMISAASSMIALFLTRVDASGRQSED
jgi:hypothetical protein